MEKQTIQKSDFEEIIEINLMKLKDSGLIFNAQKIGPGDFYDLRNADYGEGFRMPIMPEFVQLVCASLENQKYQTAKKVIRTLKSNWGTGNTSIHYFSKGMFVQDNPIMKNRIIPLFQGTLEKKLGTHEEKGVVFSEDKSIRFVPYGFKIESQSTSELAKNPGIIALTGSEENAEKLVKVSKEHFKGKPYFWALENVKNPEVRVANLILDDSEDRLIVATYADKYTNNKVKYSTFGILNKK